MGKQRDYTGKIYDTLSKQMDGFTKTEDEFRLAMQDKQYQSKVYKTLSTQMEGFSRKEDEFYSLIQGVKKKEPTQPTSESTSSDTSLESQKSSTNKWIGGGGFESKSEGETVTQKTVSDIASVPKKKEELEGSQIWERTKSTMSTFGKSVIDGVAATSLESVAIMAKLVDDELKEITGSKEPTKSIQDYQTYKWAKSIMKTTDEVFAPNPEFQGETQEVIAQAFGDIAGLIATAVITKNPSSALSKLGTKGIVKGLNNSKTRGVILKEIAKDSVIGLSKPTTFIAASQVGTRNYDQALADGATEDEANAMYWSTAITGGIANKLPIGSLLNRFDKASGGKMKELIVGGVVGGVEEALTEGLEEVMTNIAAKNIYDETRQLFDGVAESSTMGGGIGTVLNVFGVKLGSLRNKYKNNPSKIEEIDQSLDYIKDLAELEGKKSAIKLTKEEQQKVDKYTEIQNAEDTPQKIKEVAKEKLDEIVNKKVEEAKEVQEKINQLPEEEKVSLKLIDAEIESINSAIEQSKDLDITTELESRLEELNAEKQEMFNKIVPISIKKTDSRRLSQEEEQQLIIPEQERVGYYRNIKESIKKVKIAGFDIGKTFIKAFTHGDKIAIQAKEKTDARQGNTIDKLNETSAKINKIISKNKKLRDPANIVLSKNYLDDSLSKLAVLSTEQAVSTALEGKYTPDEIASIKNIAKVDVNNPIYKDVSSIKEKDIADIKAAHGQVVRDLAGQYINNDTAFKTKQVQDPKTGLITEQKITKDDIEKQILDLPNGTQIMDTIKEAEIKSKEANLELVKSKEGLKLLDEITTARNLIDEGSRYINQNKAAEKIKNKIGDAVAGNEGFYLKRSMKFWKDKNFNVSDAQKDVAISSVEGDILLTKLPRLVSSQAYQSADVETQARMEMELSKEARKEAELEVNTYLDDVRRQREDKNSFVPKIQGDRVDAKNIKRRGLINDVFLNLLGNVNDPISQFHDTVLAQSQIRAAADLQWQINENSNSEMVFDSKEALIEKNGDTKGYREVTDKNTLLANKWVADDIYDVITGDSFQKEGFAWNAYATLLSFMRKKSTIFNPAGWVTNLTGGWFTMAANGVFPIMNPKRAATFLYDRAKYTGKGEPATSEYTQNLIDRAKKNGMWNTSVSAGMIKMLDDNYSSMLEPNGNSSIKKVTSALKKADSSLKKGYSAIDDFTKLVMFDAKINIFARKLYGKNFNELTKSEKDFVDAETAERVKQNAATMSRLPRIYRSLVKLPVGEFLAFRIASVQAAKNTALNIAKDYQMAFKKGLNTVEGRAYFEDASITMASYAAIAGMSKAGWQMLSTSMMDAFSDEEDSEEVKQAKQELYVDFKGTPAIMSQWMRGKNTIVYDVFDDGTIEVVSLSNKDPYDEFFGLTIGRQGVGYLDTIEGIIDETTSINMAVSLMSSLKNGEDVWGRPLFDPDDTRTERNIKRLAYAAKVALVPPGFLNQAIQTERGAKAAALKEILSGVEMTKEEYESELTNKEKREFERGLSPSASQYIDAFMENAPSMINRTYKLDPYEQFGYALKDVYPKGIDKFEDLSQEHKENRLNRLKDIKDGYAWLNRHNELNNLNKPASETLESIKKRYRLPISDEELLYIITGQKVVE